MADYGITTSYTHVSIEMHAAYRILHHVTSGSHHLVFCKRELMFYNILHHRDLLNRAKLFFFIFMSL